MHLQKLAERGDLGAQAELAAVPPLPPLVAHLWGHFHEIAATRRFGEFGPEPISRLEIRAWEADEGHTLELWERRALLALDRAWRKAQRAEEDEPVEQA